MNVIRERVELAPYCNYKTGGPARYFASPTDEESLKEVLELAAAEGWKYEIIGGGCNLLISDDGYDGLIIHTGGINRYILRNGKSVYCGAGVKLMDLAVYSGESSLAGLENLAGIPGSVGGALKMNAGAFGREIKDTVSRVFIMNTKGQSFSFSTEEAGFGYRKSSGLNGLIITGGEFAFKEGDKDLLAKARKDILARRKIKQPLDKPSCGSVFKRPALGYAGAYIEECGLKGLRKGGAVISDKHANFILNDSSASSRDIKFLIDTVIETVEREKGVVLEPEVKFIGFD